MRLSTTVAMRLALKIVVRLYRAIIEYLVEKCFWTAVSPSFPTIQSTHRTFCCTVQPVFGILRAYASVLVNSDIDNKNAIARRHIFVLNSLKELFNMEKIIKGIPLVDIWCL